MPQTKDDIELARLLDERDSLHSALQKNSEAIRRLSIISPFMENFQEDHPNRLTMVDDAFGDYASFIYRARIDPDVRRSRKS
jgi:hypothetical protein